MRRLGSVAVAVVRWKLLSSAYDYHFTSADPFSSSFELCLCLGVFSLAPVSAGFWSEGLLFFELA